MVQLAGNFDLTNDPRVDMQIARGIGNAIAMPIESYRINQEKKRKQALENRFVSIIADSMRTGKTGAQTLDALSRVPELADSDLQKAFVLEQYQQQQKQQYMMQLAQAKLQNEAEIAAAKPQRPIAVSPGSTLVDPTTGKPMFTAEAKPVTLGQGQSLVNPSTGEVVAQGQEKDTNLKTVDTNDGIAVFDPRSGQLTQTGVKGKNANNTLVIDVEEDGKPIKILIDKSTGAELKRWDDVKKLQPPIYRQDEKGTWKLEGTTATQVTGIGGKASNTNEKAIIAENEKLAKRGKNISPNDLEGYKALSQKWGVPLEWVTIKPESTYEYEGKTETEPAKEGWQFVFPKEKIEGQQQTGKLQSIMPSLDASTQALVQQALQNGYSEDEILGTLGQQ